jgi:16S rRNA (guanine1516-N2)-methyltransferase
VATARGEAATALVCTQEGWVAESARGRLAFHQGTAAKRLRALRHGDTDPLVRAGELRPGDRVLDATLGLGRDALVAAWAVGPDGAVLGVEADLVLALLAAEGFAGGIPRPGSAPVEVRHGDSRRLLATMAAAGEAVDVVLLDPMFTDPRDSDTGFALARDHTVPTPLDPGWVALARSVARRWVVVTAERARPWFPEAGLERLGGTRSGRWFRTHPSPA